MEWLLLIATIPGQNSGLRVRFWRQLKAVGAANLRDGVYLLPWRENLQATLSSVRNDLMSADGSAYVLRQPEPEPAVQQEWMGLFDRREAYGEWRTDLDKVLATLPSLTEPEVRRQLRLVRRSLEALEAIDYFPGEAQEQAKRAWQDAEARVTRHYSPDEPLAAWGEIPRLEKQAYRGRRWATRRRPWVDRIACAWLIRRFIDPDAAFVWLADIHDCPQDALGFDFDGAAFTHIGNRVSFEVLLASFGLDQDPALARLASLVHALDVGGEPTPEALGFEAILGGARTRIADDDSLLAEMSGVLDSLYVTFQSPSSAGRA
ncbi:MAG TPA: chromate resistance protein ChrB domain-containing protein [Rhodocyclaceae bacterium]|nr:chromate resistance protein ChrB domain-containing protein [Rhodocyclaceae bacterium]